MRNRGTAGAPLVVPGQYPAEWTFQYPRNANGPAGSGPLAAPGNWRAFTRRFTVWGQFAFNDCLYVVDRTHPADR